VYLLTGIAIWTPQAPCSTCEDDYGTSVQASIGDHLVRTYGRLLRLTAEEYEVALS
jgi:hypothetical protein